MEKPNFPYTATPERYNKWEKEPVKVVNVLEHLGMPTKQKVEGNQAVPKDIVDIDDAPLKNPDCPNIVFGRPHAGEFVPEEIFDAASETGIKTFSTIDRGTSDIFKSEKIPSAGTKISRFVVDPNRPPVLGVKSEHSKAPGGVLWYKDVFGTDLPIYKEGEEPTEEKAHDLAERLYLPYYNGMMGLIGSLADRRRDKNERILVVDGHSFPMNEWVDSLLERYYGIDDSSILPMFILGDIDGKTCDADIREAFIKALEKNFQTLPENLRAKLLAKIKGGLVGLNHPFKGVHNVKFYGQRDRGVNSLQVEVNENAYIDDIDGDYFKFRYNDEHIKEIQKLIEKTCLDVDKLLKNKL